MPTKGERKYEAVGRDVVPEVYRLIDEIVKKHHATDLAEARIGVMYVYDVASDRDERTWWGKARLISAKEREYHPHDFVIELNFDAWRALEPKQQRALIDHELCHCGAAIDDAGETTYYIRKHDLEEFHEIVERHGLWRKEAEEFVRRATGGVEPSLFDLKPAPSKAEAAIKDLHALAAANGRTISVDGNKITFGVTEQPAPAEAVADDQEDDPEDDDAADWVDGDDCRALLDLDKADIQADLDAKVSGWVVTVRERSEQNGAGEAARASAKLGATCSSKDFRLLAFVSAPDVDTLIERAAEADKAVDQTQKRSAVKKKGAAKRERAKAAGVEDKRTASAGR